MRNTCLNAVFLMALITCSISASAKEDDDSIVQKLQNPVANLISVPIQSNWDFGIGQTDAMRYTVNVQPVIPFKLTDEWTLITRTIIPFIHAEATVQDGLNLSGLGDIQQSFFFARPPTANGIIWGVGPIFAYPTASDDRLGSEKFGLGPAGLLLQQKKPWTYGIQVNQVWSVAGNSNRQEISAMLLNPFLSYATPTKTTFSFSSDASYDWIDNQWTVPIQAGVSQLVKIGQQPMSFGITGRYYAKASSGSADWALRFTMTFIFSQ
jgi:hypothetical protein